MGNLLKDRVSPAFLFENIDIDYDGPMKIHLSKFKGRGTIKGYIAIFICLSTKIIHLKAVEDLNSAAFIAAFIRLTSRRGHRR